MIYRRASTLDLYFALGRHFGVNHSRCFLERRDNWTKRKASRKLMAVWNISIVPMHIHKRYELRDRITDETRFSLQISVHDVHEYGR